MMLLRAASEASPDLSDLASYDVGVPCLGLGFRFRVGDIIGPSA